MGVFTLEMAYYVLLIVYFARCVSLVSAVAEWKSVFPCEMEPRSQGLCDSLFSVVLNFPEVRDSCFEQVPGVGWSWGKGLHVLYDI